MSGPIAKSALIEGLAAHIAASLQLDADNAEEMDGAMQIADAAADYFRTSVRGAPTGSGTTLLWAIYSALLEGDVPQEELDQFFSSVTIDPMTMFQAWKTMSITDKASVHTVALIPGRLDEADIESVVAALYNNRA